MRVAPTIILAPEEREQLERWSRGRSTPQRLVLRSKIVLLASQRKTNKEIIEELNTNPVTVGRWRSRFALLRIEGIRRDACTPTRTEAQPLTLDCEEDSRYDAQPKTSR